MSENQQTIERGTYEIIRDRLLEQSKSLGAKADGLNAQRLELFGASELAVVGSERIRTENNCVPCDMAAVGERLLFGYNVYIGLKSEIRVEDVFSLHRFSHGEGAVSIAPIPLQEPGNLLADPGFVDDFHELYRYYRNSRLQAIRNTGSKLLAVFQIGDSPLDIRVFRWAVDPQGEAVYIDNRGERDYAFPPSHDYEWTPAGREDYVTGRHPHISILDEVFVETVGGDLTVKIEDNTDDGLGIFREPVEDADQSLDDASVEYARLGTLILIKVLPYREDTWRYLVFNTRTDQVLRIDSIGQACLQLPEDHGIVFPGGYYLQSGETKAFDTDVEGMEFKRMLRSPNGEDVLYIFHRRDEGRYILLNYNLIRREMAHPILCHGYCLFGDGALVIFRALSDDPARVHPMQVWRTPFVSDEHAAQAPLGESHLHKVGNADLVRGISDALSLCRAVQEQQPSLKIYEDLIAAANRMLDSYYWLEHEEAGDLETEVRGIRETAELIVDEFEKTEAIKKQAQDAVDAAQSELEEVFRNLRPEHWSDIIEFVDCIGELRRQRGHLITLREMRYADTARLDELESQVVEHFDRVSAQAVEFLQDERSLAQYHRRIAELAAASEQVRTVAQCAPLSEQLESIASGLDLLTEIVTGLEIDEATVRTAILESVSEVLSALNRTRAMLQGKRKDLLTQEGSAEFAVQFQLFSQSVSGALSMADDPEKCEEQLSRLLVQLEDLEGRFSEFDEFLEQLATKREDVYEAFNGKRQRLADERQRRAARVMQAAERILEGIQRRTAAIAGEDDLNAYFAGDPMVAKVRDLSQKLRQLKDSVRADEVESRLKAARQDAGRSLRDRQELFEDGQNVIKLGRHRFSVNTQKLDLTLIARDGRLDLHLTGTGFFEPIDAAEFEGARGFWDQNLVSEDNSVYRGEFLAAELLAAAEEERDGLSLAILREAALDEESMLQLVRKRAAERYEEGYERGVHDADAAKILCELTLLYFTSGLLRFAPLPRAMAALFWAGCGSQGPSHESLAGGDRASLEDQFDPRGAWIRRARSLARLRNSYSRSPAISSFTDELSKEIAQFTQQRGILTLDPEDARMAGAYLFEEIARSPIRFSVSSEAKSLADSFRAALRSTGAEREFDDDLRALESDLKNRWQLAVAWLQGFLRQDSHPEAAQKVHAIEEAAVLMLTQDVGPRRFADSESAAAVEGLLGQHPRIEGGSLRLRLDEFLARLGQFRHRSVPGFRAYQQLRHEALERERRRLRLEEYKPKVMSAFVRNRLIDEVYLPLIGDNLAKQLGALGAGKRTDLMGLLLLISPPGYGKTTLMEYVASRLGLTFMKVNGPSLGHSVGSLDPSEAPNATSRQEIEKVNLSFEMGNNVMLYLDDIQHTHPEFLQKFISLCDAQRRVEGVWRGRTRTYDLRGKRFCICMAGNPYTESGEKFRIPDMLANRADIYNLGDILEGKGDLFALSYLENALTSNPYLAPLTTRPRGDIHKLAAMAQGQQIQTDQLEHPYSAAEVGDILAVLRHLTRIQQVLLMVNQEYIRSASQEDAFRNEPPFLLQGSYRNMNKLAEKAVPVMNDDELEALIDDHYQGESQTLTTGAEANILKLAQLRGRMTPEQRDRWDEIKRSYKRVQVMGASEDDPVTRVVGQIALVSERLGDLGKTIQESADLRSAANGESDSESDSAALEALKMLTERLPAAIAPAAAEPNRGEELAQSLSRGLAAISKRLDHVGSELAAALQSSPSDPAQALPQSAQATAHLAPVLERLDRTLQILGAADRQGQRAEDADSPRQAQTGGPGSLPSDVFGVLDGMFAGLEDEILPATRSLRRRLESDSDKALSRQLERLLVQFDSLKNYLRMLKLSSDATRIRDRAQESED